MNIFTKSFTKARHSKSRCTLFVILNTTYITTTVSEQIIDLNIEPIISVLLLISVIVLSVNTTRCTSKAPGA